MKVINTSGKRKCAIARATLRPGRGKVMINDKLLDNYEPKICRLKIREPLIIAEPALSKVDIDVKITGGGINSQSEAAKLAIARAIVEYSKDAKIEKNYLNYDRQLLVADVRRKETHKPNRHGKARAKVQKSYR